MQFALVACLGMVSPGTMAKPGDCAGWSDLAPSADISLATIKSGLKVFFIKGITEQAGCPKAGAGCTGKSFVLAGDQVIISGRDSGWACAEFVNAKGLVTTGWLPGDALQNVPTATGPVNWTGTWLGNPEQSIIVRAGKRVGTLVLQGDATFGALDPERVRRGGVNIGSFYAMVRDESGTIAFTVGDDAKTLAYDDGDAYSCRLRLRRLGRYLLVEDNRMCGGNNVSFRGDYSRK